MFKRPASAGSPQPPRVLVIEDEALIALETCDHLVDWGYEVCGIAATERDALRTAERARPDVAVVDVNLKDGDDGVSVARRLRDLCGAAVVFVTGSNDSRSRQRIMAMDPKACIFKPYDPAELRSALAAAVA